MSARIVLSAILTLALFSATALGAGGGGGGSGDESDWSAKSTEFRSGVAAIEANDFKAAQAWFSKAMAAAPKDADAANYLGFSYRKLGDYDNAVRYYRQALALNPKHLGAYEYLGETYLELKDLAQAKQQLAKLDDLCWLGCKEYRELKAAVKKYEQGKG